MLEQVEAATPQPSAALHGLRVIEFGGPVAAPFCGHLLALLGADVIKVEPPSVGDPARHHGPFPRDAADPERSGLFLALNASKKSVTLDVSKAEGRALLIELVTRSDILVESGVPSQMEEWALDFAHLREVNSRLIVMSLTPFGWSGPYRDYKAYDINCQALSGMVEGLGWPPREPLAYPYSQAAVQAGLSAACATCVAVLLRGRTNEGCHVDISETEVLAALHMGIYVLSYIFMGNKAMRGNAIESRRIYPHGFTKAKDGYVYRNAPQLAQWLRFLEIVGNPKWVKEPRYRDRRAMAAEYPAEVDALLAPWFMARSREQVFRECQEKRVPFCPVFNIGESMESPQIKARGFLAEVERTDTGPLRHPGLPVHFSATPWRITRPAPFLGEHNEEIYRGLLGMDEKRLAELRASGTV